MLDGNLGQKKKLDKKYTFSVSKEGNILDTAVDFGIVSKGGSWYSYEGERLGQGRDRVKEYMKENPEFTQMLYDKIMQKIDEKRAEKERQRAEKADAVAANNPSADEE